MKSTFTGLSDEVIQSALDTTSEIAEKCNAAYYRGNYLPKYYDVPEGETERSLLVKKTMEGARNYGMAKNKEFMADVQNEINVIDRNGYSGYFLIVSDYVGSARRNGVIVGDGRGSGAGSKVAWLTDITKIPPHHYDLLFERFLCDNREPDFDVDFSDQDAVFTDLQSKYGEANVARVIAFGTMTPKSVVRKVFSCFDHDTPTINAISNLIPNLCEKLIDAVKESDELKAYVRRYKVEFEVIQRLEGVISHESQHAGGVIICKDLSSILPVKTKAEDRKKRIVAFDKYMLAELG
jgi:DNA polymerase-3 subunit alpha